MLDPALRYFMEVVDCGSIRLAADRLQIAPSAISRQIQVLEHRFGAALPVRSKVAETLLKEEADIGIALDPPLRNEESLTPILPA